MNIPKEKAKDYYGYMNFVYPKKVFDNYKITHGIYSHPAEEGYLFVLGFLKTFIISSYLREYEENVQEEERYFHKFIAEHDIKEEQLFDYSSDKLLDIIQYIADGRSSSSNDAYVHLALRNQIIRNLEYYKKYDLIEELSYVSYYLFLNKEETILDFCKKAKRKFFW